jgi:hypothetical protein
MKAALAVLAAVLVLLVTLPIWFYLLYKVLVAVNATDLMWFLYWAYVPATFVASGIGSVIKAIDD